MLKELKFVQGSVSTKDLVPGMTHFCIEGGHVRGYNGTIALSAPIPFDIDCKPHAARFVKAIAKCQTEEPVTITMTGGGRLRVAQGEFKAFIELVEQDTPHVEPEGEEMLFDGEVVLEAFKTINQFVSKDASRPWSTGVLLRGNSAIATNNVTIAEYWLGAPVPRTVNIPGLAIKEMLRINLPPLRAQVAERSITFHYEDGRWLRSQLYDTDWPEVAPLLISPSQCNPQPLPDEFFVALDKIQPFTDDSGRVYINAGVLSTSPEYDKEGASYKVAGLENVSGIYSLEMLMLLKGLAKQIDLTKYPRPCNWFGDTIRGAIIGMRQI